MDVITNSKTTKIHTTHIILNFPADATETSYTLQGVHFFPDKIVVKNIYFQNPSTNGDSLFTLSSTLFEPNSKYSLALASSETFTNVNLSFMNSRDVNQTHLFNLYGLTTSAHNSAIRIILSVEFLKY